MRSILNRNVRLDPGAEPQPGIVTGSARQVVSQMQDLLTRPGSTSSSAARTR